MHLLHGMELRIRRRCGAGSGTGGFLVLQGRGGWRTTVYEQLGCCYERGTGVAQDFSAAVQWYRRSAEAGYDEAMANLGYCYEAGRGVEQSWPEAIRWYEKAAEAGNGRAMEILPGATTAVRV